MLWRLFEADTLCADRMRFYHWGWEWIRRKPASVFAENVWAVLVERPYVFDIHHNWADIRRYEARRPNLVRQHVPLDLKNWGIQCSKEITFWIGAESRSIPRNISGVVLIVRTDDKSWLPWYWTPALFPLYAAAGERIDLAFDEQELLRMHPF